ncbi:FecR family protein [Variovorax sp. HJSM1_2]|uniref:FecR family protein n=1 Tax=Variovorax sp. HJSM1_2 TaxID=3366263 RepID=UPI003BE68BF7
MIEAHDSMARRAQAIQREAQSWVVRLASQHVTAEDGLAFKRWCAASTEHATAFVQVRAVWKELAVAAERVERADQAGRARSAAPRETSHHGRRAFIGAALAASVGYLVVRPPLGLWPAVTDLAADFRTGTGEQRELLIAEGVVVQMNTRTRVDVRSKSGQASTLELLEGEAEVRADAGGRSRSVLLVAGNSAIVADGARFNVRYIGGEVCVTCLAGQVAIRRGGAQTTIDAGRQVVYASSGPGVSRLVDAETVSAWRRRQLVFDQTPLATVVAEVNRYRPGKLILTNAEIGQKRVHASLSIDRLDDVVALMRDVYRLDVTHLPGGIVLLGKAAA